MSQQQTVTQIRAEMYLLGQVDPLAALEARRCGLTLDLLVQQHCGLTTDGHHTPEGAALLRDFLDMLGIAELCDPKLVKAEMRAMLKKAGPKDLAKRAAIRASYATALDHYRKLTTVKQSA